MQCPRWATTSSSSERLPVQIESLVFSTQLADVTAQAIHEVITTPEQLVDRGAFAEELVPGQALADMLQCLGERRLRVVF
jgi:hypothetical protein